jgi:hypothetical protein
MNRGAGICDSADRIVMARTQYFVDTLAKIVYHVLLVPLASSHD